MDVLSFSTAVDIAVARGAAVLPYRWRDPSAQAYATSKGAALSPISPSSLLSVAAGSVLLMPSPNGSTLAMGSRARVTLTACLRNCRAAGRPKRKPPWPFSKTAAAASARRAQRVSSDIFRDIQAHQAQLLGGGRGSAAAAAYIGSSADGP